MVIAQVGAFLIFKDLADISQWLIQSSRKFTMSVWYNRWAITIVTLVALGVSTVIWWQSQPVGRGAMIALVVLCFFNLYAGMINTKLMFRPQMHGGQAKFVSVGDAPGYLSQMSHASYESEKYETPDEINVIVLETDEGAIAYTDYYLLQPHVVSAGLIDGEEVIMTYCGLTNMGVAYSPTIGEQKVDLRVMTQLRNNLVMLDMNSGEPIQQMWGAMEKDGEHGPSMKEWPTLRMPFGSFRKLYPNGRVYVNGIDQQSDNFLVRLFDYLVRDGMMLHAVRTLQWQSDKPAFPTVKEFDDRLPVKALVYGINVDDDHVAYTQEFVREQGGIINVSIGSRPIVIYSDSEYDSLVAFYNPSGSDVLKVDLFGESDKGVLQRVETLKSKIFWFIWRDFYKQTDLNRV
ncbi:MAG: hypothetical protein ACJAUG_000365 [Halioglobus sp.]|jgi:hypothetical protein